MNKKFLAAAIAATVYAPVIAFAQDAETSTPAIEEMLVISQKQTTYSNNAVTDEMMAQTSPISSVLDVVDNLPGVLINEGGAFGGDDWSTTISMRGFEVNLDSQQLGMTVDGIPNGNSNYGGGAKANRYIDTFNLAGVEVSQGTADIASRSHEALGGSLNFLTSDPIESERLRTAVSVGDHNAQKFYGRYDTGAIFDQTYAWVSYSTSSNDSWIDQSGESSRDHIAGKLKGYYDDVAITAYISYDDTHEDNYQRLFSLEEFAQNPDWDRLTGDWTGIPHIDQLYRRGWSTLRENLLAYVKADFSFGAVNLNTNVYYHDNEGRGDWIPPYVADVRQDGNGPHSELMHDQTYFGGSFLGLLTFVNAEGEAVAPIEGCESSLVFPYGGAGANFDPACHPAGSLPVSSYRHTHYEKQRIGFNADFDWVADLGAATNTLRGGIWYENYQRNESRDWHKVIDSRTSYHFDHIPYWVQYDRDYPTDTFMYYLDDSIEVGGFTARLGVKQFLVDLEREDNLSGAQNSISVNTDSDPLLSGGLVYQLPVEGLEIFYGYAENFAAIKDPVLEAAGSNLEGVEPETAENQDLGLRFESNNVVASATYYQIEFDNRITYIPEGTSSGIDYLNELDGSYTNVGGIESKGVEAALQLNVLETLNFYFSYTHNESEYLGTGDIDTDESLGIFVGNTVAGSAQDMFVASANWYRGPYSAGLSVKYVGERYLDEENKQELDAYNLADLYFGVDLGQVSPAIQGMNIKFNVSNLTDEDYLGGVSGGGAWIGPSRTASATLTMDF